MSALPKLEVCFYFVLWITGVSVSLYKLFLVGQVFDHRDHDQYHYEDFKNGWKFLNGRFQDQADYEWKTWTSLVIKLTPFLLVNLIGAEIIRFSRAFQYLPLWYISMTTLFLLCHFTPFLIIWFVIQTLIYCLFIHIKNHILLWVFSYTAVHYLRLEYWLVEKEDDQYLIMVSSSWMILRCISYSSDKLNEVHGKKKQVLSISDILVFLSYSFYLPTMFWGPFISFDYFHKGIQTKTCKWTLSRAFTIALSFLRCLFWFSFTLFALHFIYVNAILLRPNVSNEDLNGNPYWQIKEETLKATNFVKHLLDWELAGLGIAMGHFFHLKYIVFYGIPCSWAAAEGFTTPKLPCCVSRIHLYSYMWRKFDHGFYQFLVRYIYVPTVTKLKGKEFVRKTAASVLCFLFVFAWHGQHDYVFFWALFNFLAIAIELSAHHLCALPSAQSFLHQYLSPRNRLRLQCFLAAPLHCFSMVSNYFFIGNGVDIGFIYLRRVVYGSAQSKLVVLLFLYGAGQSAVATQRWEKKKVSH